MNLTELKMWIRREIKTVISKDTYVDMEKQIDQVVEGIIKQMYAVGSACFITGVALCGLATFIYFYISGVINERF